MAEMAQTEDRRHGDNKDLEMRAVSELMSTISDLRFPPSRVHMYLEAHSLLLTNQNKQHSYNGTLCICACDPNTISILTYFYKRVVKILNSQT